MPYPMEGLPQQVTIYEVGPRDGLQNESAVVPVEVKLEFLDRLAAVDDPSLIELFAGIGRAHRAHRAQPG